MRPCPGRPAAIAAAAAPARFAAAVAALLAVSAGCTSRTTVEITVVHAEGLAMDRFVLAVERDGVAAVERTYPRTSVDGETIVLWFTPDARGAVAITGRALAGASGDETARGSVTVTLAGERRLSATLALGEAPPDAGGGADAGTPGADSGDAGEAFDSGGPVDAGDAATPPVDSGPLPSDSGPLPSDSGPPPPDPTGCDDTYAGALFCDGFESGNFFAWTTQEAMMGTIAPDPTVVFRGDWSARAEITAMDGNAFVQTDSLGGLTSGDVWLRGWFRFTSGWTFDSFSILYAGEDSAPFEGDSLVTLPGDGLKAYIGPTPEDVLTPVTLPRDTWVCVVLHLSLGNTTGAAEVIVDGTTVGSAGGLDTLPDGGLDFLLAGFVFTASGQGPGVLYMDEIVADVAPVACD